MKLEIREATRQVSLVGGRGQRPTLHYVSAHRRWTALQARQRRCHQVKTPSVVCSAGKSEKSESGLVTTALFLGSTLATAALFDAAYSGDWSRIGAITPATEEALKSVAKVVLCERVALAVLIFTKREEIQKEEKVPWTLAKAILGGTPTVYRKIFF
jgi:hypothetical protein